MSIDLNNSANDQVYQSQKQQTSIANENVSEVFEDSLNDIKLFLKKYNEQYAQSFEREEVLINDMNKFLSMLKDYQVFLSQKLKNYKDRINRFSLAFKDEKSE